MDLTQRISAITTIFLDMDGTLLDTEAVYKRAWKKAAQNLDFHIDDTLYKQLVGRPFNTCLKFIKHYLPAHVTIDAFREQLIRLEHDCIKKGHLSMKPGAKKLLHLLQHSDYFTALVTSSLRQNVHHHFGPTCHKTLFNAVITFEDTTQHKPHPAPYLKACSELNVFPHQTLAIEDSNAGVNISN